MYSGSVQIVTLDSAEGCGTACQEVNPEVNSIGRGVRVLVSSVVNIWGSKVSCNHVPVSKYSAMH